MATKKLLPLVQMAGAGLLDQVAPVTVTPEDTRQSMMRNPYQTRGLPPELGIQQNPYDTGRGFVDSFTPMAPNTGRFKTEEDATFWNSETGTFEKKPEAPWYKRMMDDPAFMDRLALGFNTMRLNPDQQLASILGERIKTASEVGRQNKTAQRVAVELQNQGRFKEAAMVEANPEIAKDMLAALMKPTKSFLTMSGAQANKMLGSNVFKPDQAVKLDESTMEFSGIGSAGTNVTIEDKRQSATQEGWGKDLVTRTQQYQQAGQASNKLLQGVRNLESILEKIDQGPWEKREQQLREVFASIGFPVDAIKLAQGQSALAAGNAIVIEELRKNKGPQTDFDAQFQTTILPSIGNAPEANRQITAYITSINLLDTIYGREASKVRGMEFKQGNDIISRLDELSTTVPAVAKIGDQWVQFSAYYNKSKALNPQASGMEIVEKWQKAIGQ